MFGPKALDRAIVACLNLAVKKALELPAVREKMTSLGNVPREETVEQFRATIKADRAKWAKVVKTSAPPSTKSTSGGGWRQEAFCSHALELLGLREWRPRR